MEGFIATPMAVNNRNSRFGQSEFLGKQLNHLFVCLAILWRHSHIHPHARAWEIQFNSELNIFPCSILGGVEDRIANLGGLQCIAEGWIAWSSGIQASEEVSYLMHKGVLVTDAEAGHPPFVHVGHIAVSYMHTAPTAGGGVVAVVEELEAVEVM